MREGLEACDRTAGSRYGHYSWRDVYEVMHAAGGIAHE